MRALPLLLVFLAVAPASALDVCYYNGRARVVEVRSVKCIDMHQANFADSDVYNFKCGVTNTFNLLGSICENPCKSALKGITAHARHNRTVVYGPPLLLGGAGGFMTFGLFEGSCHQLRSRVQQGLKSEVANMTDDDLIKAADLPPPGKK
jgi:hypothetical protein